MVNDGILLSHAALGVLGTLAALWVFVEALNATDNNLVRMQRVSLTVAALFTLAGIFGGFWYVKYYASDKALILKGPWVFAHNVFMETKEHLFFVPLILAWYLPLAARMKLAANPTARALVLTVSACIVLTGLAMEGAGAVVSFGVRAAYAHIATK